MIGETILNRYQIESELGKGGMGIVYKAHDALLDRAVAIKFLNAAGIGTSGKVRMLQEARASAKLNHPNIVSVYDAGEIDKSPFIVMEFVEGNTLRQHTTSNLMEALTAVWDICKALDHAHTNGIIHRDLKLENVIITGTQTVKLMDFGLARTSGQEHLTEEGTIIGTFAYLAPELIEGNQASPQSDLYALGVILYELLTGTAPFTGTISEILSQHMQAKVKPPSKLNSNVPAWVDGLVLDLLNKRPEERPASVRNVLRILEKQVTEPDPTFQYTVTTKTRNNLPRQLTSFIGREKEIQAIKDAINASRLVTLTGVGGTGKTRLSLQAASALLDEFTDGIWFVELAPVTNSELIPQTVASTLQLQEVAGRPFIDAVTGFLESRDVLLLLDNCEHLIQACAEFTNQLLQKCEKVKIIITSREPLGIMGETILSVPSLTIPKTDGLPMIDALIQFESVKLFVDRACAVQPNFELNTSNAGSIAQICSRLDGIPLALELAAARIRGMGVEQVASHLDNRFRLLTGGSRTATQRQQTLGATVDWSYNLLTDKEKLLFQKTAVFIGPFTLQAVEEVCRIEGVVDTLEMLDLLQRLVDKSMVTTEERYGETYYRLLETLRQYGRDKLLASENAELLTNRHTAYFMELAKQGRIKLQGPDQILWTHRFIMMRDNLRTALEWVIETGTTEDALHFACDFYEFWLRHSDFDEARNWFSRILSLPDAQHHLEAYVKALNRFAVTHRLQGRTKEAKTHCEQALTLARLHNNKAGIADALVNMGVIFVMEADFVKAQACEEEARDLRLEIQDEWGYAVALMDLSLVYLNQNRIEETRSNINLSFEIFRKLGDIGFQLVVKWLIGNFEIEQNNITEGTRAYCDSLIAAQKLESPLNIARNFYGLYNAAMINKNYTRAVRLYMASKKVYESIGAWRNDYIEKDLAPARAALDETTFDSAAEQGYAMSAEQAIEYALEARS